MTAEQTALVERRITAEELSVIRPLYAETYPVRPLLNELDAMRAEVERLSKAHDKLVDRSVGAMAIAEGTEGYEKVPIDCPMLEAVSALRAEVAAIRKDAEQSYRNGMEAAKAICTAQKFLAEEDQWESGHDNGIAASVKAIDAALAAMQGKP